MPEEQGQKITIQCPSCRKQFHVPGANVGKQARCTCGTVFDIQPCPAAADSGDIPLKEEGDAWSPPSSLAGTFAPPPLPSQGIAPPPPPPVSPLEGLAAATTRRSPPPPPLGPSLNLAGMTAWQVAPHPTIATPCKWHAQNLAAQFCVNCRAPICPVCDFAYPNNINLCPSCATSPSRRLGSGRKTRLVMTFIFSLWSLLGMVLLLTGAVSIQISSQAELAIFGIAIIYVLMVPAVIGMALGISCIEKRQVNPPSVWVGLIVSIVVVVAWVLRYVYVYSM